MNGELAQGVALAAHGSEWLARGDGSPPPALDETSSTFRYVGALRFAAAPELGTEPAGRVADWLAALAARGARRIWLDARGRDGERLPAHVVAAFSGGIDWSLVVTGEGVAERWCARWRTQPEPRGERIWSIAYAGRPERGARPPRPPVEAARAELLRALRGAQEVALAHSELAPWADWFASASELASSPSAGEPPWHPDMLPPDGGYGTASRRLVAAAAAAWVFGGMGSWNDLTPPDELAERHRAAGERLFAAILNGLVAATNADLEPTAARA